MLKSLLIANRGEIACRVIRTAQAIGVRTVAVFSDADAKALHVRQADEAVHIGASPARESYLVGERIIAAAKSTGAEGIHPGYGFLSENADFAQAVLDAGLIWVGPKPASIRAMGLKDAAKRLMAEAGVPVTPGYLGDDQSPKSLKQEAGTIDFPVLIKAVAGGGGKGMRRVDRAEDFMDALESCKREAASSFGDDRVILERYIPSPRHIEVQIFGDSHGNVVHLFERDCSLQRRHQKVIEEAPAPGMDGATREAVCGAAVRAAQAVNYEGAGTVEFIADASGGLKPDRIWFMEMNTRLQVEHPVTEEITGVDLVEWQLRVASGEKLPKTQDELAINGHAIEARLYAEDPAKGFLPSVGRLSMFSIDDGYARIETGVEQDDEVTSFYDPMIAKIVVHADDRDGAIWRLEKCLTEMFVYPVKTNGWFLARALRSNSFNCGDIDTGLVERNAEEWTAAPTLSEDALQKAALSFAVYGGKNLAAPAFRLNSVLRPDVALAVNGQTVLAKVGDPKSPFGVMQLYDGRILWMNEGGQTYEITPFEARGSVGASAGDGAIVAPMPGRVTAVEVALGETVTKGQRLLTLEAMKMEHGLTAPFDGVVAELNAEAGAQVGEGTVLAKIHAEPSPT
ncbi:MAG: acetyl/propionyl/methylcrotonyl-CoA carboxylase subunit alpha [Sphingomicrobium sp.]